MDDIYEARRQAVLAVIRDHFDGVRADFARAAKVNPTYLSRMLKGPEDEGERKRIGEDLAREMEDALAEHGTPLLPDAFVNPPADGRVAKPPVRDHYEEEIRDYLRNIDRPGRRWLTEQCMRLAKGAEPWPDSLTTIIGLLDSIPAGDARRQACLDIQSMLQQRIDDQWKRPEPVSKAPPASDPEVPTPPTKRLRVSKKRSG